MMATYFNHESIGIEYSLIVLEGESKVKIVYQSWTQTFGKPVPNRFKPDHSVNPNPDPKLLVQPQLGGGHDSRGPVPPASQV